MTLRDAALAAVDAGLSVIPLNGKIPRVAWRAYQQRRPTPPEIHRWWATWPDAGVGIITGAISGLVVLDLDGAEGLRHVEGLPETLTARTPRGLHCYFQHPGQDVRNTVKLVPGADLRGDGGLVVAPPSRGYQWMSDHPLAPCPGWVIEASQQSRYALREHQHAGLAAPSVGATLAPDAVIPEGQRRDTLWRLGRRIKLKGWSPESIERKLHKVNALQCRPPLPAEEMARLVRQVLHAPDRPQYQRERGRQRAGVREAGGSS